MLMHGRLFLTHHGFMLDELKSLLQKSLRRKARDLVLKVIKELLHHNKDQLPWKSVLTFLFEDHALNSHAATEALLDCVHRGDKSAAVLLLLNHCGTCRIPACLPVAAMDPQYDPVDWDPDLPVDPELQGLVSAQNSRIDFGRLLQHLKTAWLATDEVRLVTYIKLAAMVHGEEGRHATARGIKYCVCDVNHRGKDVTVPLVVLSMLSNLSKDDVSLHKFLVSCAKLLVKIPEAPAGLILGNAAVYRLNRDKVRHVVNLGAPDKVAWSDVPKLDAMPSWAADKHTFRGKFGRGTRHLLKKPQLALMTESELEEFHGVRPKVGIQHFFDEGCQCVDMVTTENPFWHRTQEKYLENPPRLQKTHRMTAVYYKELRKTYPSIFNKQPKMNKSIDEEVSNDITSTTGATERLTRKRTKQMPLDVVVTKKCKNKSTKYNDSLKHESEASTSQGEKAKKELGSSVHENTKMGVTKADTSISVLHQDVTVDGSLETTEMLPNNCREGPLLQLPTGSAKVYVRADLKNGFVWKGPFRQTRADQVMFFHRAMGEILGDKHTLPVAQFGQYVRYPLHKDPEADVQITTRDFYDCIAKKQVQNGQFILRPSLGVIQIHNLPANKMADLPMTFWAHYLFRFALNVGDSGLYNAITDKNMTFLFGIDLDEYRKNVRSNSLIDYLFVKLPKKDLCKAIKHSIQSNKGVLAVMLAKHFDTAKLTGLAKGYGLEFDVDLFTSRMAKAKKALEQL